VYLTASLEGLERVAEDEGQILCRVANDGKARAELRSVKSERRQDQEAARPHGRMHRLEIPATVRLADEEVEDGAVVPQVVSAIGLPIKQVLVESENSRSAEPAPHLLLRRR